MPNTSRGELRIDLGQFRRDHRAHQPQRLGEGAGVSGTSAGRSNAKPVCSIDLRQRMAGMHARQAEAAPLAVEREQAAVGDQRDRAAGAVDVVVAPPGALMKATFGTSVRRECSVRNRITFGTTK